MLHLLHLLDRVVDILGRALAILAPVLGPDVRGIAPRLVDARGVDYRTAVIARRKRRSGDESAEEKGNG